VQYRGVVAITNAGVTPIIISEAEANKTKEEGVKVTDFRVGVRVNTEENAFEAVLISDNSSK